MQKNKRPLLMLFLFILVPLTLFLFWAKLTFNHIYNELDLTMSILESNHSSKEPVDLLQGIVFTDQFQAKHNNLGQVAVRFDNNFRINNDSVVFRIKELNSSDWFYKYTYKTDQFLPHKLFPFGFPLISDSKGKSYIFEIESISGSKPDNFVSISSIEPTFTSRYEFTREYILQNFPSMGYFAFHRSFSYLRDPDFRSSFVTSISNTLYFIFYKLLNYLENPSLTVATFIYSLPVLLYLILLIIEKDFFHELLVSKSIAAVFLKNLHIPINLIILSLVGDTLFVSLNYSLFLIIPLGIWSFVIILTRLPSKTTLYLCLFSILLMALYLFTGRPIAAEKASAWAYCFAVIAFLQTISAKYS